MAETVKDILRLISSSLQIPTIVILIILIIANLSSIEILRRIF